MYVYMLIDLKNLNLNFFFKKSEYGIWLLHCMVSKWSH